MLHTATPTELGTDNELPEGWAATTVGAMFKLSGGGTPCKNEPQNWNGSIPWLSSGDIKSYAFTAPKQMSTINYKSISQ